MHVSYKQRHVTTSSTFEFITLKANGGALCEQYFTKFEDHNSLIVRNFMPDRYDHFDPWQHDISIFTNKGSQKTEMKQ